MFDLVSDPKLLSLVGGGRLGFRSLHGCYGFFLGYGMLMFCFRNALIRGTLLFHL